MFLISLSSSTKIISFPELKNKLNSNTMNLNLIYIFLLTITILLDCFFVFMGGYNYFYQSEYFSPNNFITNYTQSILLINIFFSFLLLVFVIILNFVIKNGVFDLTKSQINVSENYIKQSFHLYSQNIQSTANYFTSEKFNMLSNNEIVTETQNLIEEISTQNISNQNIIPYASIYSQTLEILNNYYTNISNLNNNLESFITNINTISSNVSNQNTIENFSQYLQTQNTNLANYKVANFNNLSVNLNFLSFLDEEISIFQIYYNQALNKDLNKLISQNINNNFISPDFFIINNKYFFKTKTTTTSNDTLTQILNNFIYCENFAIPQFFNQSVNTHIPSTGLTLPISITNQLSPLELTEQNQSTIDLIKNYVLPSSINGQAQYSRDFQYVSLPNLNLNAGQMISYQNYDISIEPSERCFTLYYQKECKRWIICNANNILYVFTENRVFSNGAFLTLNSSLPVFTDEQNYTINNNNATYNVNSYIYFLPVIGINTSKNNFSYGNQVNNFYNFIIRYYDNLSFDFHFLSGGMLVNKSNSQLNFNTLVTSYMINTTSIYTENNNIYFPLKKSNLNNNRNYFLIIILKSEKNYPTILIVDQNGGFYTSSGLPIQSSSN